MLIRAPRVLQRVLDHVPSNAPGRKAVAGVILCAGTGQRMAPLTHRQPKPLLPVLNCPLLWWSMARIRNAVDQVRINVHYLPDRFDELSPLARSAGIQFSAHRERELSGPFGGLLSCCRSLGPVGDILVLTGDGFFEVDFASLVDGHHETGADLTIGVASVEDGSRYGVLEADDDGQVFGMREKPRGIGATDRASCGVYVVSSALLGRFAERRAPLDWVDVVRELLRGGCDVRIARIESWLDAGSPEDLLAINMALLADGLAKDLGDRIEGPFGSAWCQGPCQISPDVNFAGQVLLGADARVGSGAFIRASVVGANARIGDGARITDSLILAGARVPAGTSVSGTVSS